MYLAQTPINIWSILTSRSPTGPRPTPRTRWHPAGHWSHSHNIHPQTIPFRDFIFTCETHASTGFRRSDFDFLRWGRRMGSCISSANPSQLAMSGGTILHMHRLWPFAGSRYDFRGSKKLSAVAARNGASSILVLLIYLYMLIAILYITARLFLIYLVFKMLESLLVGSCAYLYPESIPHILDVT